MCNAHAYTLTYIHKDSVDPCLEPLPNHPVILLDNRMVRTLKLANGAQDDGRHCEDFQQLQRWMKFKHIRLSTKNFYMVMYHFICASFLAVYIAERGVKLDYSMIWRSTNPVKLMLKVWRVS